MVLQLNCPGFLREEKGLNSLPTLKTFSKILQKPDGFRFEIVNTRISTFLQDPNRKLLTLREQVFKIQDSFHWPIIYLYYIYPDQSRLTHAVVLTGWTKSGNKNMLKVRNSSKDQLGEHEVEFKVTQNMNAWNLAANQCIYVKFL